MKFTKLIKNFFSPSIVKELNHQKASLPETEGEAYFSKFIKEKDFSAMITFINNDYILTPSQESYFAEQIIELMQKKSNDISSNSYYFNYNFKNYNKEELEPFIAFAIGYQKDSMSGPILSRMFSSKNISILEDVLIRSISTDTCITNHDTKDNVISKFLSNSLSSVEKKQKAQPLFSYFDNEIKELKENNPNNSTIQNINIFQTKNSIFFPSIENSFYNSEFKIKAEIASHPYEDITYKKLPLFSRVFYYPESLYVEQLSENSFSQFFTNLIIREIVKNKNPEMLAKIALKEKCPILFAVINNLTYKIDGIEPLKVSLDDLAKLKEITQKIKNTTDNYDLHYNNLINITNIIEKDLLNYYENIEEDKLMRQKSLDYMVSQMKKENKEIRTTIMSTENFIEESNIPNELKDYFLKTLALSIQLSKIGILNLEEKNFCQQVNPMLLNLIQIHSSFSKTEQDDYNQSAKEQCSFLMDSLGNIRESVNQRTMENIGLQVEELMHHKNLKKTMTK